MQGGETLDFASEVRGGRLAVSAVVKGEGVQEEQSLQEVQSLTLQVKSVEVDPQYPQWSKEKASKRSKACRKCKA